VIARLPSLMAEMKTLQLIICVWNFVSLQMEVFKVEVFTNVELESVHF